MRGRTISLGDNSPDCHVRKYDFDCHCDKALAFFTIVKQIFPTLTINFAIVYKISKVLESLALIVRFLLRWALRIAHMRYRCCYPIPRRQSSEAYEMPFSSRTSSNRSSGHLK